MASSASATALGTAAAVGLTSSLYSWTIEDFQSAVSNGDQAAALNESNGQNRGLGSMNMEELLRNICPAEESCGAAAGAAGSVGNGNGNGGGGSANFAGQMVRVSKTAEEVWKEITGTASANGGGGKAGNGNANGKSNSNSCVSDKNDKVGVQRELTLGEMTLEDFLSKSGVVRQDNAAAASNPQENWLNFQFKPAAAAAAPQPLAIQRPLPAQQQIQRQMMQPRQIQQPAAMFGAPAAGIPALQSSSTGSVLEASPESGVTSAFVPAATAFGNGVGLSSSARGKKRALEVPEDKAVEQRQRRMIKNRESAARSRERKQAYTVELESQVTQLKEENAQLSRQQEEAKKKRFKQLMETLIPVEEMRKPPRVLRRTRTTFW
uniref:TSA: Wollemia nobilis Ref_Wollemi_Transcript_5392_2063 transcribed RNA sequence n=1 Tax=Wollemia nobilis TaxID=56998 RepID=A0A0C9SA14_9CONI